jgi:hypothetical protein
MWPFKKSAKQTTPPTFTDEEREVVQVRLSLTKEEQEEIQSFFDTMLSMGPPGHKLYVKAEHKVAMEDSWTATALHFHADSLARLIRSGVYRPDENREILTEKMLSAAYKAFAIFPVPIYAYDLACALDVADEPVEASRMFSEFLRLQSSFKAGVIQEVVMSQRDVAAAVNHASARIAA